MKRIFVQTSIILVGMITWLLPNRVDALKTCYGGPLPDGTYKTWYCADSTSCFGPHVYWYTDSDGNLTWRAYWGCI